MKRTLIAVALMALAAVANLSLARTEPHLPRKMLADFPAVLGDWKLVAEDRIDENVMQLLQVDDYLMRSYANSKGQVIGLYIGYFNSQREGKQNHSPRQCLPGAGWELAESKIIPLTSANPDSREAPVNLYLMQKDNRRDLYLWWYQGRGRIYASEYLNKLYMVIDSVRMNRTDGALVRVNMPVQAGEAATLKAQLEFIDRMAPILPEYVPN